MSERFAAERRRRWAWGAGALTLAGLAVLPSTVAPAGAQTASPVLCTPDVLADAVEFDDVPESSPHHHAVACLSAYGVVTGTSTSLFSPNALMRRDQAAGLMARASRLVEELPEGADAFDDDDQSIFEPAINSMAELGVVSGRGDRTYAPAGSLTRGQAASMAIRALQRFRPVEPAPDAFSDDDGDVHEPNIDAAAALGIIEGFGDGTFRPGQLLTRAQGASVMVETLERIAAIVKEEMEAQR